MSATEFTGSESATTPDTTETQNLKAHACALCQRRKVKCDRREPCANCSKARAECVYRAPAPQRRRPRKSPEASLLARLRRYEKLLKDFGVNAESLNGDSEVASRVEDMAIDPDKTTSKSLENPVVPGQLTGKGRHTQPAVEKGQIIVRNGKTRYLENKLWTHLGDELLDASEILPVSSEDDDEDSEPRLCSHGTAMDPHGGDLLLGYTPTNVSLRSQHPEPYQGLRLWQAFVDNVNPIVKIIHTPTVQQALLEATGHLDDVPRPMESLMFAIYSCAVYSMSNPECERITKQAKSFILPKFQCAARQALVSAGLLKTSNLTVLQAYTLFLLSMRQTYDSHSLWTLTGVAVRLAQRMGLHRDGADLKLPPFEIEIRRRLWWQILLLEARAGEFSGVGQVLREMQWTTRLPLNVDDNSLHPSMIELPAEQDGATEMLHCLIRYEIGCFLRRGGRSSLDGSRQHFSSSEISVNEKEQAIQDVEELLQRRFLQYCDPSIPLHFVSAVMAESAMCKLRFRTYHPRHYWARKESVTQEEKDVLFFTCLRILELDNIIQSNKDTQRYLWHVNSQFQFDALIHVLSELGSRATDEKINRTWQQVDQVFQHHPEMLTKTRTGLNVAISRLAVQAWNMYNRHASREQLTLYQVQSSHFRETLRFQSVTFNAGEADKVSGERKVDEYQPAMAPTESMVDALGPPFDFNTPLTDAETMDWSKWDDLVQDFELNPIGPTF